MTPWPLAVAFAAPIAGRLADRYSAGLLGGIGLAMMSAGIALIAFFPEHGTSADLMWRMALCGLGFGFFQSPNNRALLAYAPRSRSGAAGGMQSTARLLGQSIGAAGVAILFHAYSTQGENQGGNKGANIALLASAGIALAAAVISSLRPATRPM
jgi:DHA2 family multidrug resistance protein-like MFS transporter